MSDTTASAPTTARIRPQTHKARGICRYYNAPRGCFAGDKCKFLHGEPSSTEGEVSGSSGPSTNEQAPLLTPYDEAKRCRFFASGFCKRGDQCWFKHVLETPSSTTGKDKCPVADEDSDSEADPLCSICYDNPTTYGLLSGCNHIFCISCIREWRDRKTKSTDLVISGNNKKCPMCRESSNFITPSSSFIKHGTEQKEVVIRKYKESMSRVQCRYFEQSKSRQPTCPFGKDCFYKHEKADGTMHEFREGASVWMRRHAQRRRPNGSVFVFTDSDSDEARFFGLPVFNAPLLDFLNPAMALSSIGRRLRPVRPTAQATGVGVPTGRTLGPHDDNQQPDALAPFPQQNRPELGPAGAGMRQLSSDVMRDIGRSLEVLNDAMSTGATLDRISATVQSVQQRLRRETVSAAEDGDAIERLQNLADQMLASVEILQTASARTVNPFSRSPTPDPPLPHPFSGPRPSAQVTGPVELAEEEGSDDEMPELRSISASSEEGYDSLEESDDSSDDEVADREDEPSLGSVPTWQQSLLSQLFRRSSGDLDPLIPTDADADEPPPLIPISEAQSPVESDPPLHTSEGDASTHSSVPMTPSAPPPFVTDGRGRVVWTSTDATPSVESPGPAGPSGGLTSRTAEEAPLPVPAPTSPPASSRIRAPGGPAQLPRKPLPSPSMIGSSEMTTGGHGRISAASPTDESEQTLDAHSQGAGSRKD